MGQQPVEHQWWCALGEHRGFPALTLGQGQYLRQGQRVFLATGS